MSSFPARTKTPVNFPGFCLCLLLLVGAVVPAAGAGRTPPWQAPVAGQLEVLRDFEKPTTRWSAGHRGVDLALGPGEEVLAPQEGQVIFSGTVVDRQVLTLEHPDGRRSSFEPLTNPLPVGSRVEAGEVIAELDSEIQHCAPNFCLHWGVREPATDSETASRGLNYMNPLLLLGLEGPSVLLPIGHDFTA